MGNPGSQAAKGQLLGLGSYYHGRRGYHGSTGSPFSASACLYQDSPACQRSWCAPITHRNHTSFSNQHTHTDQDPGPYRYADSYSDENPVSYSYVDPYPDKDPDSNLYVDPNPDQNTGPYEYTYADHPPAPDACANRDQHPGPDSHSDTDKHPGPNSYADPHGYASPDSHSDSHGYAYPPGNPHTGTNRNTFARTDRNPTTAALIKRNHA